MARRRLPQLAGASEIHLNAGKKPWSGFSPPGLFLIFGFGIGRFRITAEGNRITVRPAAGRSYSFSVDEITRVSRRIRKKLRQYEIRRITIYTKSKRVTLNQRMCGIVDIDCYLMRHVASERILTEEIDESDKI